MQVQFRDRSFATLNDLGIYVEHYPDYSNDTYTPHGADVVLLSFIVSGQGVHMLGEEKTEERGGSLSVIHYGQQHDILGSNLEVFNIFLDPERCPLPSLPHPLCRVLSELVPLHPNFHCEINKMVRVEFTETDRLKEIARGMVEEQNNKKEGYKDILQDYLKIFLSLCCRQALASDIISSRATDTSASVLLEKLRRYIDSHYTDQLDLTQLAEKYGFTKSYLCRAFKNYTGKTIITYQLERKIQRAMLELSSNNNKILAIALDNGFNDLSFFNRKFKQITGITPQQYRQKMK